MKKGILTPRLPVLFKRIFLGCLCLGGLIFFLVEACIISGFSAAGMYDYLVGKGIRPERIIVEDKSRSTKENISFSARFLHIKEDRVGIVTSNFHVFRAMHIAEKSGYEKVCGIAAPSDAFLQINNMVREFFGVVKDFLVGNM